MKWPLLLVLSAALTLAVPVAAFADEFDRHVTHWLKTAAEESKPLQEISMEAAARLKSLAPSIDSPCIVIKTNEGNWAKALVGWGFRKGQDRPVPVLLIERFVTYRGDLSDQTTALGKDVMLFAGFSFNFDIGQVVPAGQGADVEFTDKGILKTVGDAELFPLDGSRLPRDDKPDGHDPNDHDGVLPRDFSGTWTVNADGRWYGAWELKVEESGIAQGRYISADTKSVYELYGKVTATPHNIRMTVELANAQQTIDAYLWTKDKSAMAGTVTLAGRKFGFYALRQNEKEDAKPAARE